MLVDIVRDRLEVGPDRAACYHRQEERLFSHHDGWYNAEMLTGNGVIDAARLDTGNRYLDRNLGRWLQTTMTPYFWPRRNSFCRDQYFL